MSSFFICFYFDHDLAPELRLYDKTVLRLADMTGNASTVDDWENEHRHGLITSSACNYALVYDSVVFRQSLPVIDKV